MPLQDEIPEQVSDKLKDENIRRKVISFSNSVVFIIFGTATYIFAFMVMMIADWQMQARRITDWSVEFNNNRIEPYMQIFWIGIIISSIIAIISFILSISKCGELNPDGGVKLNFFDRLFVDLQFILMIISALILIPSVYLMFSWVTESNWFNSIITSSIPQGLEPEIYQQLSQIHIYSDWAGRYIFEPKWVMFAISVILAAVFLGIEISLIQSIAKKFKNRCVFRKTILGALLFYIYKNASKNKHLFVKIMLIMIGLTLLAATGFGAIIVLSLILIFVPRFINNFEDIRRGVNEVNSGNPTYKIKIKGKGALSDLANGINNIAESQQLAIEREFRSQKTKTELITNASHDLRTPLTSMTTYVDLLKTEGIDSPNAPEYLEIISEKTERLRRLTDDLFDAAKASSGDIPVNMTTIELTSMINQAVAEMEELLLKNDIEVIFPDDLKNVYVQADGQLLWRITENILTNVGKYAFPKSRAYIDILDLGDMAALEVKNISKDKLNISTDELMERFKRGDTSRNTEGSGLGLSIAKDLSKLMGGDFNIHIDGDLFKVTVLLKKAKTDDL
jgi:signal transduction histidine kinase